MYENITGKSTILNSVYKSKLFKFLALKNEEEEKKHLLFTVTDIPHPPTVASLCYRGFSHPHILCRNNEVGLSFLVFSSD